jgi:hypothetical protein
MQVSTDVSHRNFETSAAFGSIEEEFPCLSRSNPLCPRHLRRHSIPHRPILTAVPGKNRRPIRNLTKAPRPRNDGRALSHMGLPCHGVLHQTWEERH